jgi:WD40 repeat protein
MLRVWDVASGLELHSAKVKSGSLYSVVLSGDGRKALTASWVAGQSWEEIYEMKVWDAAGGRELRTLKLVEPFRRPQHLSLSGDARLALIEYYDMVKVWDLERLCELRSFGNPARTIRGVALSADGRRSITGCAKTVKVWDVGTGQIVRSLEGHVSQLIAVALSADGRMAISVHDDRTVNVWDADTGRELATFTAYVDLACCAVSSDKTTIAVGDENGVIHYLQI